MSVLAAGALAVPGGLTSAPRSQAAGCPPVPYPGDSAPREAIARWMAYDTDARGLPGELPVMGALVASGLVNRGPGQGSDADGAGYFQMRVSVWNSGTYAGFPERPELQLQWFVDQATEVRRARIAAGSADPVADELAWGDWIADVLRPPEQQRGAYQPRLGEARQLIGPPCAPPAPQPTLEPPAAPGPAVSPAADTIAPALRIGGASRQRALRRGAVVVDVGCAERCVASATGTLTIPGAARVFRIAAKPRRVEAGRSQLLRLTLGPRVRSAARRALRTRRSLRAIVRVLAVDAAGNETAGRRTVHVTR